MLITPTDSNLYNIWGFPQLFQIYAKKWQGLGNFFYYSLLLVCSFYWVPSGQTLLQAVMYMLPQHVALCSIAIMGVRLLIPSSKGLCRCVHNFLLVDLIPGWYLDALFLHLRNGNTFYHEFSTWGLFLIML